MLFNFATSKIDVNQIEIRIKSTVRAIQNRPYFGAINDFKNRPQGDKRNDPLPRKPIPSRHHKDTGRQPNLKKMPRSPWLRPIRDFSRPLAKRAEKGPGLGRFFAP